MKEFFTLPSLKRIASAYALPARKSLGQHFLLDEGITNQIARCAGDLTLYNVIEIGPGPGGLTRSLLKAGAKKLFVVEKDARCIAIMNQLQEVAGARLEIIHGDALETDLIKTIPAPRKIVANLPYNAGTVMLLRWLEDVYVQGTEAFASLTLMFQKEVAERIVAGHGNRNYGRLSVISQWLCDCRYDFELPPEAFTPPPKVSSAVITLTPRGKPLVDVSKDALEKVVAKAFGQRRKMLRQALRGMAAPADVLLEKAGIDGTLRAEQLDVMTLGRLAQCHAELAAVSGKKDRTP
ncbi:MAG: 16S rRNA (adenine(1518)-N(6)/adenine(1519)-N(6))-dimethyltransferase RsmA [Pseudomonadota bacterium]|nr:16S rRNA (adenine(1518)-N(6)/adenine(1519)-N(6))-dimethyltransferase RsmA [Pseudomonadota bacterium]MDE3038562.1 16S rRNA (adenine(1518)-N(6)/adenine(1519)-N(6))-dimethyltransferase RsmA [Pseudomonadota bacterium]